MDIHLISIGTYSIHYPMVPQGLILEATRIELELRRLTLGSAFFTESLHGSLVSMNVFVGKNPIHSSSVSIHCSSGSLNNAEPSFLQGENLWLQCDPALLQGEPSWL